MSRPLLNLLLVILLASLVIVAWLQPGKTPEEATATISDLDPDRLDSLVLTNDNGEIRLNRVDGQWRLDNLGVPADMAQVRTLLDLPRSHSVRRYEQGAVNQTELGLDPPRARIAYDGEVIALGDTEPLGDLRYIRHGDTVHLVQDKLRSLIQAGPTDLASRRLIPPEAGLQRLELPGLVLVRQDTGGWDLDPPRPETGADALQRLVDAWRQTRALWIRPYQEREGAQSARLVFDGDDPVIDFRISRSDDELILGRQDLGVEYHLSPYHAQRLLELQAQPQAVTPTAPEEMEPAAGELDPAG